MIWINAWRVITMMEDVYPFWNWPKMNIPAYSMGEKYTSTSNFWIVNDYDAIVCVIPSTCPYPTGISFSDVTPKSFYGSVHVHAY
jgi:hypothetical protein